MQLFVNFRFVSLLVCTGLLATGLSFAQAKPLERKRFGGTAWEFSSAVDYFTTHANYDTSGNIYQLPNNGQYSDTQFDLGIRYHTKDWGYFLASSAANADSQAAGITRTNSSFSEVRGGFDFLLLHGSVDLVPVFTFGYPIEEMGTGSSSVFNGEGAIYGEALLQAQMNFSLMKLYAYAGARYQDGGRSTLIPFGLGSDLMFSAFFVGAEVGGFSNFGNDDYSSTPSSRAAVTDKYNAGSLRYFAVNPTVADAQAWLGYKLDKNLWMKGGAGMTFYGMNSANGTNFFATVQYNYGTSDNANYGGSNNYNFNPKSNPVQQKSDFQEDTSDGVDQSIFKVINQKPDSTPADNSMKIQLKKKKKAN